MIIGLCGLAGSGKDEVSAILSRRHGFAAISFAGPIYLAVSEITGMPPAKLKDRGLKEQPIPWLGKSPRELLQTLGTEWGRGMVREDIWVRIAMWRASEHEHVAITDVRFANEAALGPVQKSLHRLPAANEAVLAMPVVSRGQAGASADDHAVQRFDRPLPFGSLRVVVARMPFSAQATAPLARPL